MDKLKDFKVNIFIPAKGDSRRVENKNMKLLNGKPLIWYTIRRAVQWQQSIDCIDRIVVSTDSQEIGDFVLNEGVDYSVRFEDNSKEEDDVEVLQTLQRHVDSDDTFTRADYIVVLQPTSPIRNFQALRIHLGDMIMLNTDVAWNGCGNMYILRPNLAEILHAYLHYNKGISQKAAISGMQLYACPHESVDINEEKDFLIASRWLNKLPENPYWIPYDAQITKGEL